MAVQINSSTFEFLKDLHENNYREWFQEHKPRYEIAHANMVDFMEELMIRMGEEDHIVERSGKRSLFRIYRDVRFSKNKAPYKSNFSGSMKRATKWLRGGYYLSVQPGKTMVAGGFFSPNSEDLKRIRTEIADDDQPLRKIIADPTFQKMFGNLTGEGVKTAPMGFSKEHPAIDLIRMKQFIVERYFTDEEVLAESFLDEVVKTYMAMRPYFDYMSEVLTTDGNGLPRTDL